VNQRNTRSVFLASSLRRTARGASIGISSPISGRGKMGRARSGAHPAAARRSAIDGATGEALPARERRPGSVRRL